MGYTKTSLPMELPPEAWSSAKNVRFRDGKIIKSKGQSEIYATPSAAPLAAFPVRLGDEYWWVYLSNTQAFLYLPAHIITSRMVEVTTPVMPISLGLVVYLMGCWWLIMVLIRLKLGALHPVARVCWWTLQHGQQIIQPGR